MFNLIMGGEPDYFEHYLLLGSYQLHQEVLQ